MFLSGKWENEDKGVNSCYMHESWGKRVFTAQTPLFGRKHLAKVSGCSVCHTSLITSLLFIKSFDEKNKIKHQTGLNSAKNVLECF